MAVVKGGTFALHGASDHCPTEAWTPKALAGSNLLRKLHFV